MGGGGRKVEDTGRQRGGGVGAKEAVGQRTPGGSAERSEKTEFSVRFGWAQTIYEPNLR